MAKYGQIGFEELSTEYKKFVDKFKPKKTTDDCYTPPNIYETVLEWVREEYDIEGREIVRPFWPGGDYEREEYPERCVVVDNPPFSILSQIIRFYVAHGIDFFLFAPYLTNFTAHSDAVCHIIAPHGVVYENGAEVSTAFITSLDKVYAVRSCPDLFAKVKEADKENRRKVKKEVPKYSYPNEVITATAIGYLAVHQTPLDIRKEDVYFIRKLESQAAKGKSLFGGGFLLSERAAAERAAAERAAAERAAAERAAAERAAATVWKLSEQEKEIVRWLGKGKRTEKE